jgi:hypothetical protein
MKTQSFLPWNLITISDKPQSKPSSSKARGLGLVSIQTKLEEATPRIAGGAPLGPEWLGHLLERDDADHREDLAGGHGLSIHPIDGKI